MAFGVGSKPYGLSPFAKKKAKDGVRRTGNHLLLTIADDPEVRDSDLQRGLPGPFSG
jgi:molybdopterin/thiamine biosynthesis adenylyltransferase